MFPVIAANSVSNIVKSSLGPVGLDKMIVDDVGVRKGGEEAGLIKDYPGCENGGMERNL